MSDKLTLDYTLLNHPTDLLIRLHVAEAQLAAETARAEELCKGLTTCLDTLERLAKLGNEPLYGNSEGNRIAYSTLKEIQEQAP